MSCAVDFVQYVCLREFNFPLLRRIALHLFEDPEAYPVSLVEVLSLNSVSLAHLSALIARSSEAGDWREERRTCAHLNEMLVGLRDGIEASAAMMEARLANRQGTDAGGSGAALEARSA